VSGGDRTEGELALDGRDGSYSVRVTVTNAHLRDALRHELAQDLIRAVMAWSLAALVLGGSVPAWCLEFVDGIRVGMRDALTSRGVG
jgi:hypothetical protein